MLFGRLPNKSLGSKKQAIGQYSKEISMVTAKVEECVVGEKVHNTTVKMCIPPGSTCFPAKWRYDAV